MKKKKKGNKNNDRLVPYTVRLNDIFERCMLENPEYHALRAEIKSAGLFLHSLDLSANFIMPEEEKVQPVEPTTLVQDGQIRKNTCTIKDRRFLKARYISWGEEE